MIYTTTSCAGRPGSVDHDCRADRPAVRRASAQREAGQTVRLSDTSFPAVSCIDVALALPLFRTFTYRVPHGMTGSVVPGSRVVVPFRNKQELGIVISAAEPREGMKVKDVVSAPDDAPVMDESMLTLCRWIAEYYVVPVGVALRTALPAALTGATVPVPVRKTRRVAEIIVELTSLLQRDEVFARAPQQRALYELIEALGGRDRKSVV